MPLAVVSLWYQLLKNCHVGSVKDSVVGEERIAQYLLAVLNTRGTPFHWRHMINREMEGLHCEYDDKPENNLMDLLRKRRKPPNKSDVHYVEVISYLFVEGWMQFYLCSIYYWNAFLICCAKNVCQDIEGHFMLKFTVLYLFWGFFRLKHFVTFWK